MAPGRNLLAVLGLVLISLAAARITHRELSDDPRRLVIIEMPFGFGHGGGINVTLRNAQLHHPVNLTRTMKDSVGMFIQPAAEETVTEEYYDLECPLMNAQKVLFRFSEEGLLDNETFRVSSVPSPGQYALYFANCLEGSTVSFKAEVALFNKGAGGIDYLSVGETELPSVYLITFLLFSLMAASWAYLCWVESNNVHKIHYLMLILIVFRALTSLSEAGMYHYLRLTGDPSGWNIAFYIFTFFRGIMFFTVVVLIGTGWSYIKPFIGEKEKKILVVVIPLQILANIAIIILDETSPVRVSWFEWKDIFHLVDIICCCAILFPIVWSIKHLREGAETDGKAAVNVEKLTLFRQFYVMVVVYIYFTRIIVYLLQNTVPFQYRWTSDAAGEAATLIFYILVGIKFRPHGNNQYFKLASDAAV